LSRGEIGTAEAARIARRIGDRLPRRVARLANKTAPVARRSAKMTANDLEQGKSR
jgi:hypothetical protein